MSKQRKEYPHTLTRSQAIGLIDLMAYNMGDSGWDNLVEDLYDEDSDTEPSIYHVFAALGVTKEEYVAAIGAYNVNWPTNDFDKSK